MRNTFCLNSVSDCRQISQSPLNRSSSKHLWSFSKDSRFKADKSYCDNIYEIPSTFKIRGPAIGYGKKSDFTKDLTVSPGSSKYQLKTIFDDNRKTKRGFSMSLSRQKIPSKGYIPLQPLRVPGATKYNNLRLDAGQRYSMRMKTKVLDKTMSIDSQNNFPGAGTYQNPEALSPKGKYTVGKHRGTGATMFNPKSSTRFFQFKNTVPGPGHYQEINMLSDKGYYPLSSSNGFGKRYFDREMRVSKFEKQAKVNYTPGPGSYRNTSQFGHYDGDIYATLGNNTKSKSKLNNSTSSRKKL